MKRTRNLKSTRRIEPLTQNSWCILYLDKPGDFPAAQVVDRRECVQLSDAKVTAAPPRQILEGVDLLEELLNRSEELEWREPMLCEREWLEFSSTLQATSMSLFVHTNAPSSGLRSYSSVETPSSLMSDMAR
jgi:hypothetical protein